MMHALALALAVIALCLVGAGALDALCCVPRPRFSNPSETGIETYRRTHWGERGTTPSRASRVPSIKAGELVELGELVSVVYLTRKGGDGELVEYEHEFGRRGKGLPILAFNRSGLFVAGGSYTITTRGIEG